MPRALTIVLLVIAALALPAAMAGAALYASNAAIVNPTGELTPHFGKAAPRAPAATRLRHHAPSASPRTGSGHSGSAPRPTGGSGNGSSTGSSGSSQHRSGSSHWSDTWSGHRSSGGWDS